jgi:hypothetical protein
MSTTQQTLTGDTADQKRQRPKTLVYDYDADEWVLRRKRFQRGISTAAADRLVDPTDDDDDSNDGADEDDEDDDPVRAGGLYRVELNYTVRKTFTIPAWSEHEAEERADLLASVAGDLVHTSSREKKTIMSDDDKLPDGFDPEMGTPLWEVYGEDDE